jgi:glycerol kinase
MSTFILALDQGTTSSRAIVFKKDGRLVSSAQQEFPQIFPSPGHVEHDPEAIWSSQLSTARQAIAKAGIAPNQVDAIGVTNQRETTIVWDKATGKPVANAIVWQSRITAPICEDLKARGLEDLFHERTGLVLDPYFSGTKLKYLLDTVPGLRARAERGEVLFGTVDSFLVWRLTHGRLHITDPSNASRTLLFNINTLSWDDELLQGAGRAATDASGSPSSSEVYGETDASLLGARIPIAGHRR